MKYYLAPLEGITGYIYRNAYHQSFHPLDKYFTPFLDPNQNRRFKSREINDILPEHNHGLLVVPQILTNKAEDFNWITDELYQLGYREVNLNLGCPSRTVVTKGKGSGFLSKPDELDRFLEEIYSHAKVHISIKTRIGKDTPDEFYNLIKIFNKYPISELIIHPRVQTDYYKNKPNYDIFNTALEQSNNPIVYNGDIFSRADLESFKKSFPDIQTIMAGRGILKNPGLIGECNGLDKTSKNQLRKFHDNIYIGYQEIMSGERNVLFKMKELWLYMIHLFTNSDKYYKKIKKAERLNSYENAITALFEEQNITL